MQLDSYKLSAFAIVLPKCLTPRETCHLSRVKTPHHAINIRVSQDHDTALSAVRNLHGQEIGGRALRIDLADSDPFLEGKTTIRGELVDGGETRAQWREREQRERDRDDHRGSRGPKGESKSFLSSLPSGVPVPPGSSALDAISRTLAITDPGQILEVLAQMKVCTN